MEDNKSKWYEEFLEGHVTNSDNEDAKKLAKMIEQAVSKETQKEGSQKLTQEIVDDIRREIDYAQMNEYMKKKFTRRLRLLQNRLDRSINDNFGSLIKHLRESQGFSLKDLEGITGVSSSYINRIEKGERKAPSYQIIQQLADALHQDVSDLLSVAKSDSQDALSIEQVILTNDFTIGGKRASKETKQRLVDVITKMNAAPWIDKFKEMMDISETIDRYKEVGKK